MTNMVANHGLAVDSLVRSAATGDHAAFASLIAEHHARMARVVFVICGDAETTNDVLQAAWTIAWRRMGSLRQPSKVRSWLVAIAANEARKAARRTRQARVVDISEAIARQDGSDRIEDVEIVDLVLALRGLRPAELQLLAMRYAAGLASSEIAEQLGLSASGVRSRLARLVERLRADLAIPTEGES